MIPGDVSPISFAIDEEIFELYLRFDGREEIRIPGMGTFKALKFSAQTVAGVVFDGKEDLRSGLVTTETESRYFWNRP